MTRAVHMDATKPGDRGRTGLCGYPIVDTDADISRVTCRTCRQLFAKGATEPRPRRSSGKDATAEDAELQRALEPKAGPPPALTAPLWAGSCKGAADGWRCRLCALCEWEREAKLWGAPEVSAHNREHRLRKPENAPRWPSLAAALVAWVEGSPPAIKSALGGMIERKANGVPAPSQGTPNESAAIRMRLELLPIGSAIAKAFPPGGHATMRPSDCSHALLERTPGCHQIMHGSKAGASMPTYEELAHRYDVTEGDLRALVRCGRSVIQDDLAERGLIPASRNKRRAVALSCMRVIA